MEVLELLQTKGIEFGSRALGVHTETSDYDFAILSCHIKEHQDLFQDKTHDASKYTRYVAEGESYMIFKKKIPEGTVDILVLDRLEDVQTVSDAVNDLLQVPQYMLQDKRTRIELYNMALQEYGFTYARGREPSVRRGAATITTDLSEAFDF